MAFLNCSRVSPGPSFPIGTLFFGRLSNKLIRWDLFTTTIWTPKTHMLFPHSLRRAVEQLWLIWRCATEHPLASLPARVLRAICALLASDLPPRLICWSHREAEAVAQVTAQRRFALQGAECFQGADSLFFFGVCMCWREGVRPTTTTPFFPPSLLEWI
jgi:hypothetical protein